MRKHLIQPVLTGLGLGLVVDMVLHTIKDPLWQNIAFCIVIAILFLAGTRLVLHTNKLMREAHDELRLFEAMFKLSDKELEERFKD